VYTARRALLRARLVAAHLLDPAVPDPASWLVRARRYAAFADEAIGAAMMGSPDAQRPS